MSEDKFQENKKFLKRYKPFLRQLKRLEERLYQLDDRIESTHSARITGMPGGGIPRGLNDELGQREELEQRINNLLMESRPIKHEILSTLDHLDNPNQANVLELFFINDMDLYTISENLDYSFRQANRLYKEGILNVIPMS
ncbi:hypothetical protein [Companilactobacillus kimchii]|uniref:DUF1492 domain-containing protein n=2 Tax=Companilactobacillus kimchii TaxID=2801452 RepID=A0ABR5NW81_9LACO|nr:hypothetical protein [Companilactobacillus kimchii]KAE9561300.1 hypothetical protein ATN91_07625 [Companilactobacillus kimchii]KRK53121.1 hypothetical protein FC97_GL001586 [Companilactobacillus kimchii DSM 13961 = JCM 10707]OWF32828.1 hypothetical protein LKACC12383_01701 [Companilactobacillus kimchii]GEO48475.1 hypothetical protein LKI01_24740 [Companilactobacillus paralimentarius]